MTANLENEVFFMKQFYKPNKTLKRIDDEEADEEAERINYLTFFVNKMLNAPIKMNNKKPTQLVDVRVTEEEIRIISIYASVSFAADPSLRRINESVLPIHIVGDIHGQFNDLRLIFANCGHPSTTSYLFLGDYVDRGMQGVETIVLLMALQSLYPQTIILLRGNHEDYNTSLTYGFYDECLMKYGSNGEMVWLHLVSAFNHLPFSALIIDKIFCTHGGISPNMQNVSDIDKIVRPTIIPSYGLACDLVWSDPESNSTHSGYMLSSRGISFSFDDSIIHEFCENNQLDLVIRAHQITSEMLHGGYKFHANGRMMTIFSAPNYLNMKNDGCVIRIDKNKILKPFVIRPIISNFKKKFSLSATAELPVE